MEGLDRREINQRIDLLNYPLMPDIWTRDDSYPHLSISHFSIMMLSLYIIDTNEGIETTKG